MKQSEKHKQSQNLALTKFFLSFWSFLYLTGLDPAGPLISGIEKKNRLDPSHAVFVDAIHTDTRLITLEENLLTGYRWEFFFLGTNKRMAKSDFYPNDGYEQPGCAKITIGTYFLILTFIWNVIPCFKPTYKFLLRKLDLKFM